ncbi:MAG TPA: alpha/beta fold hydrolase, partial [Mycobacteriales bacterium]|nr:alpha/beta fold hydrolase [Mycobacteriales bacterium]
LIERGRRSQSDLAYVLVRRYGFGSPVPPAVVDHLARMVASTPFDVMSEFFPTFVDHDKLAVLPAFAAVPTVVLAGEDDLLTPAEHSRAIAAAVPGSELVLLADAGHMVMLERPALVNLHLRAFLRRVGGTRRRRAASA